MKHRRAWISLFTVCALLGQGAASAWMASSMAAPVPTEQTQSAMPCHADAQEHNSAQQDGVVNCCDGDASCNCAALCGAGFALASSATLLALIPAAEPAGTAAADAVIPAYTLSPLRPPITSQS